MFRCLLCFVAIHLKGLSISNLPTLNSFICSHILLSPLQAYQFLDPLSPFVPAMPSPLPRYISEFSSSNSFVWYQINVSLFPFLVFGCPLFTKDFPRTLQVSSKVHQHTFSFHPLLLFLNHQYILKFILASLKELQTFSK